MSVSVTTQAELDQALADGADVIYIDSPAGVWLTLSSSGSAHVEAWDSAHVEAWDSAHVVARGSAHVVARGSAHVVARDSAHVVARGSAHVVARGSAHVEAWDSAHVVAWGSAHVVARDSAHVEAWGSAHVEAWDSAHVEAWDSAHVKARPYVAVHLHSARATVEGGVVIDIASLDLTDPAVWCGMQGVDIDITDGRAVVYKAVNDDLRSEHGTRYPLGGTVTAPDWRNDGECGGGLHFGPTPKHAQAYNSAATRFLACSIPVDAACGIPDGTAKIKARECVVLYEVDVDGKPIEAVVS